MQIKAIIFILLIVLPSACIEQKSERAEEREWDLAYINPALALIYKINAEEKMNIIGVSTKAGSGIVVSPEISSLKEFIDTDKDESKSKDMGVPHIASFQYLLLKKFAEENGLDLKDMHIKAYLGFDTFQSLEQAYEDGEIAGYVTTEPYLARAKANGLKVLCTSEEIWRSEPCCILISDPDFLRDNEELVERFLLANEEATEWINSALRDKDCEEYMLLMDIAENFTELEMGILNAQSIDYNCTMDERFEADLIEYIKNLLELGMIDEDYFEDKYGTVDDFISETVVKLSPDEDGEEVEIKVGYSRDVHTLTYAVAMNETVGGGTSIFEKYGIRVIGVEDPEYLGIPTC